MRRITGKLIKAVNDANTVSDSQAPSAPHKAEDFNPEAFYLRMMDRDLYIHISEISVAMIGVCLTGVSIMQVGQDIEAANTYIDDLLAIDSFVFLTSCLMAYWLIRVTMKGHRYARRVSGIANLIFILGMVLMAIVCGSIVLQGDYSIAKIAP